MHFPSLSSTLPRRWRTSNTEVANSDKKPPKSSSSLRRRLSNLSTISSESQSSSSQRPPKSGYPSGTSHVTRSSSFSSRAPLEDRTYCTQYNNSNLYDSYHSGKESVKKKSLRNHNFDFKKPLPPPPKPHAHRRSFLQGVILNKPDRSPFPVRRSSDTSIPNVKEWKSQSLVELNCDTAAQTHSQTLLAVKPNISNQGKKEGRKSFSKPFYTFGTPQAKRKLSVPTYLSSSLNGGSDTNKNIPFYSISSSQDNINCISKDLQGSSSSLSQPGISTATIFSKNLRSNSWRNLSLIGKVEPIRPDQNCPIGGMNKSHRLSHGAKKVTPPSIPSFNPRGSGSSFGSDYSYEKDDSAFSRDPSGGTTSIPVHRSNFPKETLSTETSPIMPSGMNKANTISSADTHTMEDQGIDMTLSPGRDSPGDDSSASIGTVESSSLSSGGVGPGTHVVGSFGGCRNSTTSLDSGRASNTNSAATNSNDGTNNGYQVSTFHTIQPIQEHRAMVNVHPPHPSSGLVPNRLYSHSNSHSSDQGHGSKYPNHGSSFRQSYHSSTSSLGSADRAGEDTICALNIPEMVANGVPDHEILLAWLTDLHYEEYYELFVSAGYDMPTISRMTPEDLTAIGIKKPNHRKRLKSEITLLNIPDGLPPYIPESLEEWLHCIRLSEYVNQLRQEGYFTIDDVAHISIEDFEDVGLYKLGHQKRLLLAIKRLKELKSGRRMAQFHPPPGSFQVTASPLPSRSNLNQNHIAGKMQNPYGHHHSQKQLQNLAKPTIPPQVPQTRQSSTNALKFNTPNFDNSNKAHSNNVLQCSVEKIGGIQQSDDFSVHQAQTNISQHIDAIGISKPMYQPEVIRIDSGPTSLPAAPSPLAQSYPHSLYPNVSSPAPPPPPPPLRQSSCLSEPVDGGSPPPPSPPNMPQPMAPLFSTYSRFQDQQQYLPQNMGFQTSFQNPYVREASNEPPSNQGATEKPWATTSMTRSFDDGDIVQNQYLSGNRGFFAQNGGANIVRNLNGLINNSGGGTLPRPKGLVKPRPVAKIAANPQIPLQQKQSVSKMSDLHEDDMCKTSLSSFGSSGEPSTSQQLITEKKFGSQKSLGCYDQGETFANDNVGTIRMRSNSHILGHLTETVGSGDALSVGSLNNEQNVQYGHSKLVTEQNAEMSSSQDASKRSMADGVANGQRSAGDVLNDIGSMLSDLTDELDAMLHMERDPLKN